MKIAHAIDKNDPDFIEFLENLSEFLHSYHAEHFPNLPKQVIKVSQGRKYVKIVKSNSVFAFINRENGDILKPASFKAPAKHARGNIFNSDPLSCIGPYGVAYLK